MMIKQGSRAVFDSLLAKTHVQHALVQPDGRHNEFPTVSLRHLSCHRSKANTLRPWLPWSSSMRLRTAFKPPTT